MNPREPLVACRGQTPAIIIDGPLRAGLRTVRFDRDILFARKRLRASAWLTLMSRALVQLSLASHQFDHAATDLADHCEVCVQLERLDDAASGAALPTVALVPARDPNTRAAVIAVNPSRPGAFDPRAPPVS